MNVWFYPLKNHWNIHNQIYYIYSIHLHKWNDYGFKQSFGSVLWGLRPATLLKKRFWHRCFPVNFTKFLRKPIFIEHLWWLLLYGGVLKSTQDYYQTHKTTSLKTIHKRLIYGSRKMLFLFAFLQITASDCNVSDTDAIRITIAMKLCQGILMSDWPGQKFFKYLFGMKLA